MEELDWSQWLTVAICVLCLLLYSVTLPLTISRRHKNIIRKRTYPLVLISSFGILANIIATTFGCLYLTSIRPEGIWADFYLGMATEYVFYAPYLLRAYHMRICFATALETGDNCEKQRYLLKPKGYLMVLILGLAPFLLVPLGFGVLGIWAPHVPFTFSYHEIDPHLCVLYSFIRMIWTPIHCLQVFCLLLMLYKLRHIEERYSMNKEMQLVCVLLFLLNAVDFPSNDTQRVTYIMFLLRDLGLLLVSSLWPVLFIWNERTVVIPTPESLYSFEFALENVETLHAFLKFLRELRALPNDNYVTESASTTGTQDGEAYLWFIVRIGGLEARPKLTTAYRIFQRFLDNGETGFPASIVEEAKAALRGCKSSDKVAIVKAFLNAKFFACDMLRSQYYPLFTASEMFKDLQKKVERNTKIIGSIHTSIMEHES